MSFEVFVQCFTNGERDGVPDLEIQKAFGSHLSVQDEKWWRAYYDELNSSDILVQRLPADRRLVHFMSVQRPCGDPRLWDALVAILRLGHFVLYFPAKKPPLLIPDESVARHQPKDMVESMGKLVPVRSGQDICHEIQTA